MSSLRITAGVTRGPTVRFRYDGAEMTGHAGETVAVALLAAGIPRLFCAMGSCQDCLVVIEGRRTEACRVAVREGLVVESAPQR